MISKSVISYISWDLILPDIRLITLWADMIPARALGREGCVPRWRLNRAEFVPAESLYTYSTVLPGPPIPPSRFEVQQRLLLSAWRLIEADYTDMLLAPSC